MVEPTSGSRWRSTVCATQVIVVHTGGDPVDLRCGGQAMVPHDEAGEPEGTPAAGLDGGTLVGKRYTDAAGTIELLCTKPGAGTLTVGGEVLAVKGAKPLPASD
jgi:hypothetical protein